MKSKIFILCIAFLTAMASFGKTDKYRLILVDDPSSTITIAWNQISGNNPLVYFDSIDHGSNIGLYKYSKAVDKSLTYRGMNNQFVLLKNLKANTAYYFVIQDSEGNSQRFWFKTAPSDNSRLSFIAGGDSRNNRSPRQKANLLVSKLKPHAVLFGGDMTDDDTDAEWRNWFDDWQLTTSKDGRMIPIVPTRGNHEGTNTIFNLFNTPTADAYYAMTWGKNLVRTYTLNSEISVYGNQKTWLEDDLNQSANLVWKMAQYHKPMRPHTAGKSEGNALYDAWAQLFFDKKVRLVVDCDSHLPKTTWPIQPSIEKGNDEGFIINEHQGTVYTGEGCWGAPLRPNNDDKSWTRNSGSFNQFKLIFIDENKIELRTIKVDNADDVAEGNNEDPFALPNNLDVFSPKTGAVVTITNENVSNPCNPVGTPCDDNNPATLYDEEDGYCNCQGIDSNDLRKDEIGIQDGNDDAEESLIDSTVDLGSTDLELIYDNSKQLVGVRFRNLPILKGSKIYRAYIQFQTDETNAERDPTHLIIHAEKSVNSLPFSDVKGNLSSRTKTVNVVTWDSIAQWKTVGEAGVQQRTPYLTNLVEEIVAQADWEAGNSISFLFSGKGKRVAESFEGGGNPKLVLFFQNPCNPKGTPCDDGNPNTFLDIEDGNCNCTGIPQSGTLSYQVTSSADDAEEGESGSVYLTSSDLELIFDSYASQNNQTVGIRFQNIHLPQDALINSAYIQFTVDEEDSEKDPTNLLFYGEKTANSLTFEDIDNNISQRPLTSSFAEWNNIALWNTRGESGKDQQSPDLKEIIQEIIQDKDWQILNALSIVVKGEGKRVAESYNGAPASAPKLIIEYAIKTGVINKLNNNSDIKIYPNPAKKLVWVKSHKPIQKIEVFNAHGKKLKEMSCELANKYLMDISSLQGGTYLLHIHHKNGKIDIERLVIKCF